MILNIKANDVLFFRDSRPMAAGSSAAGHGARWPEPSTLFDALHAALHRAFPERCQWEHEHRLVRPGQHVTDQRNQRFGSLTTVGPFPCRAKAGDSQPQWFFPRPLDYRGARPCDFSKTGRSNLPSPLKYEVAEANQKKEEGGRNWIDKETYEAYLRRSGIDENNADVGIPNTELFTNEQSFGIATDRGRRGTITGRLYTAEYMRLREDVSLGTAATMKAKSGEDLLPHLFPETDILICGGQQRACHVQTIEGSLANLLPVSQTIEGNRLKWVLLSPAVFPVLAGNGMEHPGGWLPTWVRPADGQVMLKAGDRSRQAGESREAWRARIKAMPELDCKLVAALVGKPISLSYWKQRLHLKDDEEAQQASAGPSRTYHAVPAGSVYYFEGPDARLLANQLSWHGGDSDNATEVVNRRSNLFGEKGFGLGVCAPWELA